MIKAIIFDFDGVLHDTFELAYSLNEKISPGLTQEEFKKMFEGNIYSSPRITDEASKRFFEMQDKEFEKLLISHHVKESLNLLKKKYRLFIITSNKGSTLKKYMGRSNMDGVFSEILGVEAHKSKHAKFEMIFKRHNLSKEECIFVTDTLGDILEGNEVGVKTIAVDYGFHERVRLKRGKTIAIISDLKEIIEIIKKIN